jgi:hypothetical protein
VRKDHQVRLLEHHPDVLTAHLLAGAATEALVAGDDLLTELATQAIGAKQLVERLSDSVLSLDVDQVEQLEVASNVSVGHSDADVFEVLLQRE